MQLPILVRVGLIALPIVLAAQGPARAEDGAPAAPAATRRIAPIPDAAGLMDQNGRPLTEAAFAGRIRLVYFGYTHCPDSCPTALATVTQALDRLPPEIARRIVPVLVAADPARDDARVLGAYLEAFHPGFVAVTGPVAAIDDLAWSYGGPDPAPSGRGGGGLRGGPFHRPPPRRPGRRPHRPPALRDRAGRPGGAAAGERRRGRDAPGRPALEPRPIALQRAGKSAAPVRFGATDPLSRAGEGWGEGCALSGEVAPLTRSAIADSTTPGRER